MTRTAKISLPGETAHKIFNHPHARYYIPAIQGQWFRSKSTDEWCFEAEVSPAVLTEFLQGLEMLKEQK